MEAFGFLFHLLLLGLVHGDTNFVYKGFAPKTNLSLNGAAYVRSDGILAITNDSSKLIGHALYSSPIRFKEMQHNSRNKSAVVTFSTNFVFSTTPRYPDLGGHGLAFVLMSTKEPKGCLPNQYLGLPNDTSNERFSTKILAVEFDTAQNLELQDINDNHVGIDISSLVSNISEPAGYYFNISNSKNSIVLKNGDPIQAWIDYTSKEMLMNVTIAPLGVPRPVRPLISFPIDLSRVVDDYMFVGFSASTGLLASAHNVHGWSFRAGGKAQDLDPLELPMFARRSREVVHKKGFAVGVTLACVVLFLLVIYGVIQVLRRYRNCDETLEEWELEYGTRRFKYSELFSATGGFRDKNLIGSGGFGKVYRGIIPSTGLEVAIKRVSPGSNQGMKEFVAEITSMGRLRHRNLVQLHGWCRRRDQLLLVYDYITNGSLDKLLFDNDQHKKKLLTWEQRYKIIIGVARALLYLHEECEQRVVHRDVKPSNVLIDEDLNAKLGDFGLAKTSEHGINAQTTHIVGTLGYMAPELTRTGKATSSTDVYGYGVLMLEIACGRRPIEPQKNAEELVLVDWVRELHARGEILEAVDPSLEMYDEHEVKLVLGLGLLCSHPHPDYRPNMRRVVQFLLRDANLPPLPTNVHLEVSVTGLIEYSGSVPDPSSTSNSFSSFDKKVSTGKSTRISF